MNQPNFKDYDIGLLFGGKESGQTIQGYEAIDNEAWNSYIPTEKTNYVPPDILRFVLTWFKDDNPEPLYIFGSTGCGKSEVIKQTCAKLNYPLFELTGSERLEVLDLVGHQTIKDGNMHFEYGALAKAMMEGGVFMLNEIDLCSPSVLAGLNTILDGSNLLISENNSEVIKPKAGFKFVVTANTNGAGNESGHYQGTIKQNLAFLDRFLILEMGYLPSKLEIAQLTKEFPDMSQKIIEDMVKFANDVRKAHNNEAEEYSEVTMSHRTLIRWGKLAQKYSELKSLQGSSEPPILIALKHSLTNKASETTKTYLMELYNMYSFSDSLKKDFNQ